MLMTMSPFPSSLLSPGASPGRPRPLIGQVHGARSLIGQCRSRDLNTGLWLVRPQCISWSPLTSHASITQLVLNDKSLTTLRTWHSVPAGQMTNERARIAGWDQWEAKHGSRHHYPPGTENTYIWDKSGKREMGSRKRLKFGSYSSFYLCTFPDRNEWRQMGWLSNKLDPLIGQISSPSQSPNQAPKSQNSIWTWIDIRFT